MMERQFIAVQPVYYYFLLPIYGKESIALEPNFRIEDFNGFKRFEIL